MDKHTIARALGKSLRARRKGAGYSQDTFADQIKMHRAQYAAIERGHRNITLPTLRRVAAGLGVSMAELLTGID